MDSMVRSFNDFVQVIKGEVSMNLVNLEGKFKKMGGKFLGVVCLFFFTFYFVLSGVVLAGKPVDEPIRPVVVYDPGAKSAPPPDPDSSSSSSGDLRLIGLYPEIFLGEETTIEKESRSSSLLWVVWFDLLITLFQ